MARGKRRREERRRHRFGPHRSPRCCAIDRMSSSHCLVAGLSFYSHFPFFPSFFPFPSLPFSPSLSFPLVPHRPAPLSFLPFLPFTALTVRKGPCIRPCLDSLILYTDAYLLVSTPIARRPSRCQTPRTRHAHNPPRSFVSSLLVPLTMQHLIVQSDFEVDNPDIILRSSASKSGQETDFRARVQDLTNASSVFGDAFAAAIGHETGQNGLPVVRMQESQATLKGFLAFVHNEPGQMPDLDNMPPSELLDPVGRIAQVQRRDAADGGCLTIEVRRLFDVAAASRGCPNARNVSCLQEPLPFRKREWPSGAQAAGPLRRERILCKCPGRAQPPRQSRSDHPPACPAGDVRFQFARHTGEFLNERICLCHHLLSLSHS